MTIDAFRQQLEAIRAEYRRNLPATIARLDSLWRDLANGSAEPRRLADLLRELHTIAGSAKTLGVAGVSDAAAAAESFLEPYSKRCKLPGTAQQAKFSRLLEGLTRAAR